MLPYHARHTRPTGILFRFGRCTRRHWKEISLVLFLTLIELVVHVRSFRISRPTADLDPPFHVGCQGPIENTESRANATLVMLARNSDADGTVASVLSVQKEFNNNFAYP